MDDRQYDRSIEVRKSFETGAGGQSNATRPIARMERGEDPRAPALTSRTLTPLEAIHERILRQSRDVREIGVKLHEHADAVHGSVPIDSRLREEVEDRPASALDRISRALDDLDNSLGYMAEGAGRNTTPA